MTDPQLLLVDDDPGTIQSLSRMLVEYPNLRFATSGADAPRLAREITPDLMLLDAGMPELPGRSGFEVCKALRSRRPPPPP